MEDPAREIEGVVRTLTMGSPDEQLLTLQRTYTRDAAFDHPLCRVLSGLESIIGIYTWYRILFPWTKMTVTDVAINDSRSRLVVDCTQTCTYFLPIRSATVRLVVVLTLTKEERGGKHVYKIRKQEDFYQPESILSFVIPGIFYFILILKHLATLTCNINAGIGHTLGLWKPKNRK
ncbi:hypothetical protein BT69DRAFT_985628 [Atractiella rhizophila]|nr:hypothetical protein BT69DRAFT_985628 [Atractiella rhizophila]